jgi:filamentous hemagglutinin family protein
MLPLVSLVITTYNREQFLGAAIASVLQQTYSDFELLVWDDGSTDGSVELAQSYARQDNRVRVIAAEHLGRVEALRAAIAQTQGTYLGWIDSDDLLAPTALEKTVQVLEQYPDTGMVYTDYVDIDEQGKELQYGYRCHIPYSPDRLLVDFMVFHFRLLRRSHYDQVDGIDGSLDFVEDYDLCLRLSEVTEIRRVQEPLYYYRIHPNNASQEFNTEQLLRTHMILEQALQRRGMADTHAISLDLPTGQFSLYHKKKSIPSSFSPPLPLLITLPLIGILSTTAVHAQSIVPAADGTNTVVTPAGNQLDISGGTLSGNGVNLFHSFERFGLTQGQIANFLANPQLQNILGRISGNSPSVIDGRIQITGGSPNLFLLNPAGIIFGPNASLNIPAAFTASTANAVGLGNGWFHATGANNYELLTGTPDRMAFTTSQPGSIVNAGNLAVGLGQNLNLLGGVVVNTGTLSAPGGQIVIGAVPGQNLVRLSQPGNLLSLEFQPLTAANSPTTTTTTSAPTLPQLLTGGNLGNATGLSVNPDGTVQLTGSNTTIPTTTGTAIASGTITAANQTPGQTGGAVAVLGTRVGIVGATIDASGTNGGGSVYLGGDYQGKGTLPTANQTVISADSTIRADATQQGNGGRVITWANQSTSFWGNITARGGAISGNGGFVEVSGKENLLFRGDVNTSAPNGLTGTLLLDPTDIFIVAGGPVAGFSGQTLFADPGPTTIFQNQLENLPAGTNIQLQATNSITFDPAIGILRFRPGPGGEIRFEAGGGITMDPGNVLIAPERNVTFIGGSLSLGTINTSSIGSFEVAGSNGGNITLQATGNITTGNLIANGSGYGSPAIAGAIDVRSTNGSITVGNISASADTNPQNPRFQPISGNTVSLTTLSNGGTITVQSIDTRGQGIDFGEGIPDPANGGNVIISAKGEVRGIGEIPSLSGTTIATGGAFGGTNGTVSIQHDGGPTNQSFTVANGAVTVGSGNGTVAAIATGNETIAGQTFDFPSSPSTSPGSSVRITFTNDTPTINAISSLPTAIPNQPVNLTVADLGINTTDQNADQVFVRIVAIAPGAILRINGIVATPGSLLPADATLEFIPPPGFKGLLANAFSIQVDDRISVSPPRPISITVGADVPNSCQVTGCKSLDPTNPSSVPDVTLEPDPPEDRFKSTFEGYLGLAETRTKSLDELRQIAQEIEKDTGAKPAFLYISFVPKFLKPGNILGSVKLTHDQQSGTEQDEDQLELIMVTAKGAVVRHRLPDVTRAQVLRLAHQFRLEVSDPRKTRTDSYLKLAQQLHQWFIAPLQSELQARQINNLVFLMDTGLRSLPVAALHDGKNFLVEQYSIGMMPSLSLTDTRYQDIRNVKLLTLGISESTQGQVPLPSVLVEVSTLVKQLWSGESYLNQTATIESLKAARQQRPYGIVHLATHADFLPGSLDNSYIQLWDEKVRLDQVRQLGFNNPQVELLVLSACSTALGDREAELGFGGLAVQAGVKTAVASLWAVNDVATAALITRFYHDLRTLPIKSEAMRQAQLAMIKGQVYVENDQIFGVQPSGIPLPEGSHIRDRELSHPYYWSAFTMIGNPW